MLGGGFNAIVTVVNCFIDSFWKAEMVVKIRSIIPSAERLIWSRDCVNRTQWSLTSAK